MKPEKKKGVSSAKRQEQERAGPQMWEAVGIRYELQTVGL